VDSAAGRLGEVLSLSTEKGRGVCLGNEDDGDDPCDCGEKRMEDCQSLKGSVDDKGRRSATDQQRSQT
jgi:hypothetical protein